MFACNGVPLDHDIDEVDHIWRTGISVLKAVFANSLNYDAELLQQLPSSRVFKAFAVENLASGELPKSPVSLVEGPPTEQELVVALEIFLKKF